MAPDVSYYVWYIYISLSYIYQREVLHKVRTDGYNVILIVVCCTVHAIPGLVFHYISFSFYYFRYHQLPRMEACL